jgi:hypothetical protein
MLPGANINPLKVSLIVCDNASVNTVVIKKIYLYLSSKYPQENGSTHKILPVDCMAHIIHHVVIVIQNYSMELLQKLGSFVRLTHMSQTKQSALTNSIKIANIQQEKKLRLQKIRMDVVTC